MYATPAALSQSFTNTCEVATNLSGPADTVLTSAEESKAQLPCFSAYTVTKRPSGDLMPLACSFFAISHEFCCL